VGGTICNNHTLEPFKEQVLILKKLRNLLPSFMFTLSITLPNLSIPDVPFPAQIKTLIRRRLQVKPATLLIPIDLFFGGEFYGTQYQSDSFSLIIVGSFFSSPALSSFYFFPFVFFPRNPACK
jgi:hypothetical protein